MSKRYNEVSGQTYIKMAQRFNRVRYPRRGAGLAIVIIVMLATLACGFFGTKPTSAPNRVVIRVQLPTLTPTPLPNLIPADDSTFTTATTIAEPAATLATPIASSPALVAVPAEILATDTANAAQPNITSTPTVLAVGSPPPASSSAPIATPVPENRGWAFDNLAQVSMEDSLVISGEAINNTGLVQELDVMGGLFYDEQGQVIANDRNMETLWSASVVLPGERVPFEIVVDGIEAAANFELSIEAQPVDNP